MAVADRQRRRIPTIRPACRRSAAQWRTRCSTSTAATEATFSGTTPGNVTRTFTSFSEVCADIVDARVWSGIHFRFADEEAAKIGRRVAHWGNRHAFR